MEKNKCKVCGRRFGSGRALGGHMRSHFTILPVPTKTHLSQQVSEIETLSTSSSSELKIKKKKKKRSRTEFDQVEMSSVSDETSSEEDHLAMCLILLSRDKWVTAEQQVQEEEEEQNPVVKIHECQVCYKVFKSGQALGGHKRSHLLLTSASSATTAAAEDDDVWLIDLNLPAPLEEAEDINQTQIPVLC